MLAKSLLTLAAWFVLGCSDDMKSHDTPQSGGSAGSSGSAAHVSGAGAVPSGDRLQVVPEGIAVSPRPGINSVFKVVALTLRQGSAGAELFAAVRNDGDVAACNPYFSAELHDKDDQTVGAGISGLMVRRFYRFTDGTDTIAGCVSPGDVTMVALTDLSLNTALEDVESIVYASGYWFLSDVIAIDGVSLAQVEAVNRSGGVAYTGALVNGLDVAINHPTVAVFPLDALGRPLAVAYGGAMLEIPPGGTWDFETNSVGEAGVGFDAYPMGGP